MARKTGISWTEATYNPWWGCTKVSPACDNCYAETSSTNKGWHVWGPGTSRKRMTEATRRAPLTWEREAVREGKRIRVFTLSMGDIMDGEVPQEWREEVRDLIDRTPHLDWQLLTKRPENYHRFLPSSFAHPNVWLGTTAENQHYYNIRWPAMAKLRERFPSAPLWISYEPALGPLSVADHDDKPDWIIFGGESGHGFRSMDVRWAEQIKAECEQFDIRFHLKQMAAGSTVSAKNLIPQHLKIREYPSLVQIAGVTA
jgi:protein gp37